MVYKFAANYQKHFFHTGLHIKKLQVIMLLVVNDAIASRPCLGFYFTIVILLEGSHDAFLSTTADHI